MTLANQGGMDFSALETVLVTGNLTGLTPAQRVDYYARVCQSVGLNPLTKPFQYITFQGNLTLYAGRNCTDQLAKIHGISLEVDSGRDVQGTWVVRATATDASGRKADAIGAVALGGLKGEALANGLMKAETKAKRRAVLSFTGLSMLDATETETISDARPANVDEHGVINPQRPELPSPDQKYDSWEQWARSLEATTAAEWNGILDSLSEDAPANQKNWLVHVATERGWGFDKSQLRFLDPAVNRETGEIVEGGAALCRECRDAPALENSAYCGACESLLLGDQQPAMMPAGEQH